MSLNAVHNILNALLAVLLVLVGLDWTSFGLDPGTAKTLGVWLGAAVGGLKLVLNIARDGLGGLFLPQPPVQK